MDNIVTLPASVNPDDTLEEHAAEIRRGLQEIQRAMANALALALAVGKRLNIAKDQVPEGKWGRWLRENCFIGHSTAKLYMRLASHQTIIEDELVMTPELSVRAARRLLTKSTQSEVKEAAAEEPGEDEPDAASASAEPDHAAALLAAWKAASIAERKDFLATITLDAMLKVMPDDWRPELERRVLGNAAAHCGTKKERAAVRRLRKKRPYMELTATPIA
jgi:hypothetical protein